MISVKTLLKRPSKKTIVTILITILLVGGYWLYSNDLLGPLSRKDDGSPKPGQQVGPPPTSKPSDNPTPTDVIQVVPEGDGPDIPHPENKPAFSG